MPLHLGKLCTGDCLSDLTNAIDNQTHWRGSKRQIRGLSCACRHAQRAYSALKKRYEVALDEYESLSDLCERSVSRWVWATAPRYDLDPLFFLDSDLRVGKIAPAPPQDPRGYVAYGISRENRIVTERQYPVDLEDVCYKGFIRKKPIGRAVTISTMTWRWDV